MTFSEKMSYCIKNGIKVYPVFNHGFAYIVVKHGKTTKKYDKPLNTSKEISNAMTKTYEYYYNFLTQIKK